MPGPITAQLGRISGPLLASNLVRNGVDLSVETDLLYLNVSDGRVGLNTDTPTADLEILGTTRLINQEVIGLADVANIGFNADGSIYSNVGPIIVSPNQSLAPYLEFERNITDSLEINDNFIRNRLSTPDVLASSILLQASGTGSVILDNNTAILGDLNVQGNITINGDLSKQGNIIIGNNILEDTVTVGTDFTQGIIPGDNLLYNLGSPSRRWRDVYITDPTTALFNVSQFVNISDQLAINGNTRTIFTLQSNENLIIDPASGGLVVEEIKFGGLSGEYATITIDNPNAFGTSASDIFGGSIDISESYVIAGAASEDEAGFSGSGKAYIFDKSTGTLLHTLNNPNVFGTPAFDSFGSLVAITDSYAAVYASAEDQRGGTQAGKVYLFNPATGALVHTLDNPNPEFTAASDVFGSGLSLGDRYLTVGSTERLGGFTGSGALFIYDLDNYATEEISITWEDGATNNLPNGFSVTPTSLPGFSSDDLFTRIRIDSIDVRGQLNNGGLDVKWRGASTYDNYFPGVSSSVYTNYAWLGGEVDFNFTKALTIDVLPSGLIGGSAPGMPGGLWWQIRLNMTVTRLVGVKYVPNPNAAGTPGNDAFATFTAVSDNYTVASAWREDNTITDSGIAYIFENSTGNLLHTLINPNAFGSANDQFGSALAITDTYTAVGVREEDDAGGGNSGKVYVFDTVAGTLLRTIDNPNAYSTSAGDQFGVSVAISGSNLIVGAHNEDEATGNNSGKVYVFDIATGALLNTIDNPNAFGTPDGDAFGTVVRAYGTDFVANAPVEDDAGGLSSGKVYIFSAIDNANNITNLDTVNPLTLINTGTGYTKFLGTNGMVIPSGDTSERNGYEVGATRWNTELEQMECFDGSIWIIATGPGATIAVSDMEELGHIYTLILG